MTYDVYVTSDRDIQFDTAGDIQIVTGTDNVLQQYMNAVFRAIERTNPTKFDPDTKKDIKVEFQEELTELEYPDVLDRLQIEQTGHDTMSITITAQGVTRSEEVEL